jgi:catechol 2,3-dioxygenase-like lactoylglutathione lyase family enzyme
MKVHRIVANIRTSDVARVRALLPWRLGPRARDGSRVDRTHGSNQKMTAQVSFATQGGSDTPVPDLSIEVDDVEVALRRVRKAGLPVEYDPKSEPWGVRRFYVRDPLGTLVNVVHHE